jgi:hypothetical protein
MRFGYETSVNVKNERIYNATSPYAFILCLRAFLTMTVNSGSTVRYFIIFASVTVKFCLPQIVIRYREVYELAKKADWE